jgi:ATP/maltotriose-dependent transcriptional regulator MalT
LLFLLAQALHKSGDPRAEQALEDAANALSADDQMERAAEAYVLLSEQSWDRGDQARAAATIERANELLVGEDSEPRARVLARMAHQQMLSGRNEEAVRAGREALAVAERLGLDEVRASLLNTIGSARCVLGEEAGKADLEESVEIALAIDSPTASSSYNNLGVANLAEGDVRRDRELREASLAVAERFGDERGVRFMRAVLHFQHAYYAGDWQQAAVDADEFIAECETGAPHYLEPMARAVRALIWLGEGALAEASEEIARAEQRGREIGEPQIVFSVLAVKLHVALETGDSPTAEAAAAEILATPLRLDVFPSSIELAWAAGDLENADAARDWITSSPARSRWNGAALLILDRELGAAGELFAEMGALADEARARLRAGDADNVAKALDFYRRAGATGYVREAEALLKGD